MNITFNDLILSWLSEDGINPTAGLLDWIKEQNEKTKVRIKRISLRDSDFWFYDETRGVIRNKNDSFFSITGIRQYKNGKLIAEQPIILQNEIGFLGIICKRINGLPHFLMQAKIEPGNINKVQISPTLQATKSNFTQKHGGRKPAFLDYFIDAKPDEKLVDQIQSEQSSRFLKKRNRNVIVLTDKDIAETTTHKWMTLGQIKRLMRYDNLVNMDTRTVISCIPFSLMSAEFERKNEIKCRDRALLNSITGCASRKTLTEIYHILNNYKMFNQNYTELVNLFALESWSMKGDCFECDTHYPFRLIFCDISIEGREVVNWTQPLFEACGIATFGLISCVDGGTRKFLIKAKPEIGCFDAVELGPTVQQEALNAHREDFVSELFNKKLSLKQGIMINVLLSEEGGRFYHEQNRNIIMEIQKNELPPELPGGYIWIDYKTLNTLVQVNNCLNIQLRNLLSLLEV